MRLYLDWRRRVVLDLATENSGLKLRVWQKVPAPEKPQDPGPPLRASASCQSVERRGWTNQPDTRVFGFGRR